MTWSLTISGRYDDPKEEQEVIERIEQLLVDLVADPGRLLNEARFTGTYHNVDFLSGGIEPAAQSEGGKDASEVPNQP